MSFYKKFGLRLAHSVQSVDRFMWKLKLGYNNVEQSIENSIGPIHDLSLSVSGAVSSSKIVWRRPCDWIHMASFRY